MTNCVLIALYKLKLFPVLPVQHHLHFVMDLSMEKQSERNTFGRIHNCKYSYKDFDMKTLARQLDSDDPLPQYRKRFHIPKLNGSEAVYLSGHLLGLQPKSTKAFISKGNLLEI